MTAESAFSVTGKVGQTLVTLRGDTYEEFVINAASVLGTDGTAFAEGIYTEALGGHNVLQPTVASVAAQFGGATAIIPQVPVSTVGGALPQPGFIPPAVSQVAAPAVAALPPLTPYPGDCPHGPRNYKDTMARGKSWKRFECALPWQSGSSPEVKAYNAQRCDNVKVGD